VWRKEELDTMIRLQKSLECHPHIAMQMMEHLPDKSLKKSEINAESRLSKPWSSNTRRLKGTQQLRNYTI
jgi:hypothetical protein